MKSTNVEQDEVNSVTKEELICNIGEKLKVVRLQKGLSHNDIVEDLKFSLTFLEALESGVWSEMPGDTYALGFLRQYADLLNVDVTEDIQRIKTKKYELTKPVTYPDATISPNKTWGIIAILLFFLVFIIANLFETNEDNATPSSNMEHEASSIAPIEDTKEPQNQAILQSKDPYATTPAQATEMQVKLTQEDNTPVVVHTFTFKAISGDVWLQVYREVANQEPALVREVYLKVHEQFSSKTTSPLFLTTGNANGLEILRDGDIIFARGTLGKKGKVLKLFPISP